MPRFCPLRYLIPALFAFSILIAWSKPITAADPNHSVIAGYERFFSGENADQVTGGTILLGELGCVACHQADNQTANLSPKQAPILSKVGGRAREKYFESMLSNPHELKPGTTMPDLLHGKTGMAKEESVKLLAAFLASTDSLPESVPTPGLIKEGEKLFHEVGCVACHSPRTEKLALNDSIPLGDLEKKYSVPGLAGFLKNPLEIRPSARMPHLNLNEKEARAIANYLLQGIDVKANLSFKYYEGDWKTLPDFSKLTPKSTGKSSGYDVHVGPRKDSFGIVFTGYLNVQRAGKYKIFVGSDDGSRIYVNGKVLIENDGIHPVVRKQSSIELKTGVQEIVVEYFEGGGGEELYMDIEGPGLKKTELGMLLSATREDASQKLEKLASVDSETTRKGQEIFASIGCASCHTLKIDNKTIASTLSAKKLSDVDPSAGCLSDTPPSTAPKYMLSDLQKSSLVAAIGSIKKGPRKENQAEFIHRTMATFNCYQCHERDKKGGVLSSRNKFFVSSEPEMGDEGRLPPPLNGVGGKLNSNWLKKILNEGANDRFYMKVRMPKFGNNVDSLHKTFLEVDKIEPFEVPKIETSLRRKKVFGRRLSGEGFLSCIKCHQFGKSKSTGIQAINLTTMTSRLNKDWFIRYMLDPQRFRPGTRMPEAFPDGQTFYDEILDGTAVQQTDAIWLYLADGENASAPKGLEKAKMELVAETEPVIYRNFIEGAGSRAIGVGYPEGVNLAFDANEIRLATLWQGSFMDASRHWTGRGQGYEKPLGENILTFFDGTTFAKIVDEKTAWPKKSAEEAGITFKGYQFNESRQPTFRYMVGDIQVSDFFVPKSENDVGYFERNFELTSKKPQTVYHRIFAANSIKPNDDGSYTVDDWKIQVKSKNRPIIRKSDGKFELILKLDVTETGTKFTTTYRW